MKRLGPDKTTGYTTTLEILQRMLEKGLLRRDERQRTHVYEAVWRAEETQRQLVRDLFAARFTGPPASWSCRPSRKSTSRPQSWPRFRRLLDDLETRPLDRPPDPN